MRRAKEGRTERDARAGGAWMSLTAREARSRDAGSGPRARRAEDDDDADAMKMQRAVRVMRVIRACVDVARACADAASAWGAREFVARRPGARAWLIASAFAAGALDIVAELAHATVNVRFEGAAYARVAFVATPFRDLDAADEKASASKRRDADARSVTDVIHARLPEARDDAANSITDAWLAFVFAFAFACAAFAALAHSSVVGYVDEMDVFGALQCIQSSASFAISAWRRRSRRRRCDLRRRGFRHARNAGDEPLSSTSTPDGVGGAALRPRHRRPLAISPAAVITAPGQRVAVVGPGRDAFFIRLARGAASHSPSSSNTCVAAFVPRREWLIPESLTRRARVCINAQMLGTAAARVDPSARARLVESLREALEGYGDALGRCRADALARPPTRRLKCDMGFARAKAMRANIILVRDPCDDVDDVRERARAILHRCDVAARRCRASTAFTTNAIAVLPECDCVIVVDDDWENSVRFIGSFGALCACSDAVATRQAFATSKSSHDDDVADEAEDEDEDDDSNSTIQRHVTSSHHEMPNVNDAWHLHRRHSSSLASRIFGVASSLASLARRRPAALGIVACAGVGPAVATFALERWLAGKRVGTSSNALACVGAAVGALCAGCVFVMDDARRRADERANDAKNHKDNDDDDDNEDGSCMAKAYACARVVFISLVMASSIAPHDPLVVVCALVVPAALMWHVEAAFRAPFANALTMEYHRACVRTARFVTRMRAGARHICVSRSENLYEDMLQHSLSEWSTLAKRVRDVRALERSWMLILITTAFTLALTVTMDNGVSSRRGIVSVVGVRAFAALDVRPSTKTSATILKTSPTTKTKSSGHHRRRQQRCVVARRASSYL